MNDFNKHLLLFECCQMTEGAQRSLLIDFQRRQFEFLDNEIYKILCSGRQKSVAAILADYPTDDAEAIAEYIDFFLENEYAFLCDSEDIAFYPALKTEWEQPFAITNCILDFDNEKMNIEPQKYLKVLTDLSDLGCENLQIRSYSGMPKATLEEILSFLNGTVIFRVELILRLDSDIEYYEHLLSYYPRINEITLHSGPFEKLIPLKGSQILYVTEQKVESASCCGVVSPGYFNLHLDHYLESRNFNTCLHKKISVDISGNIKNCPSLQTNYGSIFTRSIKDVVKDPDFLKIGGITKDQIDTCKVCEFRHICTDCRAYHEHDLSMKKPYKCNYNPYTLCWE